MLSVSDLRLIGQGREAEVFEYERGRVLKLSRATDGAAGLRFESAALRAAHSAGARVPQVYDEVVVDGRAGLVLERLEGPDLLTILGRQPWLVVSAGRRTGEIHARINAARAPASLPAAKHVAARGLARLASSEPALADQVGRVLARLPDGDALCHGDLHPGQLVFTGDRYAAIDWSGAKRGDPLFDYARTRVLLELGEPPPGTSWLLRFLTRVGRRVLSASYERAYEHHAAERVDAAQLRLWEIVNLALRLVDGIPGERPRLLRRLRLALARGEGS